MNEFVEFGRVEKFAISVRWATDSEPRARRPKKTGWSIGDLKIFIAGQAITLNRRGTASQSYVSWYLLPFFDWLATNWGALFHEEDFSWIEKSSAPALIACRRAMARLITATDETGQRRYREVQDWYHRHSLRSCSGGGLFPDLFIRRFLDDIELSWSPHPPPFAPEGFSFVAEPGTARLSVPEVAGPLWEVLNWAIAMHPAVNDEDQSAIEELKEKIEGIRQTSRRDFETFYIQPTLLEKVRSAVSGSAALALLDETRASPIPAIEFFPPAVAMFGGVDPNLDQRDVETITSLLASRINIGESETLMALTKERIGKPLGVPHQDGYAFAEELLDELEEPADADWIDLRSILERLSIDVRSNRLDTDTIRGIALAGESFGPSILLNLTSIYNLNEDGRRFTLAHELCHILFDRTRAKRVTIASGPWVAPGIEKRANAFAASLLMPTELIRRLLPTSIKITSEHITRVAQILHVSETALIEHIYNIDLISEWDRERLRVAFRAGARSMLS